MHDHRDLDHHRDICSLDRHLTQNVSFLCLFWSIFPFRYMVSPTAGLRTSVLIVSWSSRLATAMLSIWNSTGSWEQKYCKKSAVFSVKWVICRLCDFCSVQALSHEGMQKHLLHHGIDVRNPNRRQPIQIENWCTLCTPMLSFPSVSTVLLDFSFYGGLGRRNLEVRGSRSEFSLFGRAHKEFWQIFSQLRYGRSRIRDVLLARAPLHHCAILQRTSAAAVTNNTVFLLSRTPATTFT